MFGAFSESFDIMREELRSSRMREADLQKREKELVASLSHDLKTPITGIKVTCELLTAKYHASAGMEDLKEKITNIYKKADQIDVMVNDLFSATLEELGEFKVNCSDESSKILTDILKKYDDKGLVRPQDVPEVLIHIDANRMNQVIGNIISNSYKYAGTAIEVSYRIVEEYLEMSIRDHGPGVPEEELGMILGKFYRGKKWAESKEEGSGLGLYIASTLMEKMDGELVPSNEDKGFKITLMIPLS
jgi:K+-sensing histidine kinase KdpD